MEEADFREFMRDWIAAKWDGEAPEHLKKALSSGDPKDLGTLIHEWHDFKANKGQRAVVESSPTGFVYFVRNGGLFKIGITENMLRRMGELTPDELLNVVRCSNFQEVERELHRRFKDVRLPQTEYFRLSDQQVQEVHQLMVKLADFPQRSLRRRLGGRASCQFCCNRDRRKDVKTGMILTLTSYRWDSSLLLVACFWPLPCPQL